jgi:hypothetical protein
LYTNTIVLINELKKEMCVITPGAAFVFNKKKKKKMGWGWGGGDRAVLVGANI